MVLEVFGLHWAPGQHGQEVGQGQKTPILVQLPLSGTAQGDWELVLLGPVHIVAVGSHLLLESTVLGRVLRLRRKQTACEHQWAPPIPGVTPPEVETHTGGHLWYTLPLGLHY